VVPPAVLARTPSSWDFEFSEDGWRVAIWSFSEDDPRRIDARRPLTLTTVPFEKARKLVMAETPQHDEWLRDEVIQRVQCLSVLLRHGGLGLETWDAYQAELQDLLLDSTRCYGEPWVHSHLTDL
jgi:hypothetical protein